MKKKIFILINICIISLVLFCMFGNTKCLAEDGNLVETNQNDTISVDEEYYFDKKEIIDVPKIRLEASNAEAGKEFEVSVYINSKEGISTAEFSLKYDDRLEYKGEEKQKEVNYIVKENTKEQKIQISVASLSEITEEVLITKLKFKVPDNIKQETSFSITVDKVSNLFSVKNGELFKFESENVLVNVNTNNQGIKNFIKSKFNGTFYIIIAIVLAVAVIVTIIYIVKARKK